MNAQIDSLYRFYLDGQHQVDVQHQDTVATKGAPKYGACSGGKAFCPQGSLQVVAPALKWISLLLLVSSTLLGCSLASGNSQATSRNSQAKQKTAATKPQGTSKPQAKADPAKVQASQKTLSPTAYIETLKTKPGGKGLYIFAPALKDPSLSPDFSTGCSRWLHLQVSSDLQLTQTPAWYQGEYVRINLGRKDLCITTKEAKEAMETLGVTHYALGTAEPGKLSFQVYSKDAKPVGEPVVLTGDEAAIVAALPEAANALRQRLALPSTTIAPPVETPQELALIGRVPLLTGDDLSEPDATGLHSLSQKSLLGGLLYLSTYLRAEKNPEGASGRAVRLLKMAEGNPLVLAELARAYPSQEVIARINELASQAPQNAVLAEAKANTSPTREAQLAMAEQLVRNAPSNPSNWILLANKLSALGQEERRGRTADQISEQKWEKLNQAYGRWLAVARQAALLDPRSSVAALELAKAATFGGADQEARKALESAFQLGGGRRGAPEIVGWSLEMCAPKWGGSEELLEKMADRAAKLPITDILQTTTIMEKLQSRGFNKQAEQIAKAILAEAPKRLKENPDSVIAYEAQRRAYSLLGRHSEALEATKRFVELRPRDTQTRFLLVEAYQNAGQAEPALAQAKKLAEFFPNTYQSQFVLARLLHTQKKYAEAVEPAEKAARMLPSSFQAQMLAGAIFAEQKRFKEALPYCEAALALNPAESAAMFNVGAMLCELGRVPEGRKYLQECLSRTRDPERIESVKQLLKKFPEPKAK